MLALVIHQTRYDLIAFLRNKQGRYSTMIMPVVLVVVLIGAFGDHVVGPGDMKASTYYVPGIATLAVLAACFMNLVTSVTTQREAGILKHRRATPAPAAVLIAGRALTASGVALVTVAAVCLVGSVMYGVHLRAAAIPQLVLSAVVASLAFCSIAYALTTAIKSADAAQPIVQAIALPLYFISGVFIPSVSLPPWLQDVATLLPVEHVSHAFHRAFDPAVHGTAIDWGDIAVVLVWGMAALAVAVRRFRWMPATDS